MASTLGRIKSKDRVIKTVLKGKEIKYIKRGRIMTPCLNSGKYLGLPINTDKLKKSENVHRLIAITFLPNPNNLPYHIIIHMELASNVHLKNKDLLIQIA